MCVIVRMFVIFVLLWEVFLFFMLKIDCRCFWNRASKLAIFRCVRMICCKSFEGIIVWVLLSFCLWCDVIVCVN